jgi:hypothetical protein
MRIRGNAAKLQLPLKWQLHSTVNVNCLKRYVDDTVAHPDREVLDQRDKPLQIDTDQTRGEYGIERVLNRRYTGRIRSIKCSKRDGLSKMRDG